MVHVETLRFHLRSSLLRGSVYRLFPGRSADKSQSNHGRSCARHLHYGFVLDRCSLFIVASFLSFTDVYLSFSSSLQQFFNFWPSFLPWSQWAFRGACRATTCSSPSTRATRCTGICEKTGDCCGTSSEESTSCCGKKWRGDRSICSLSGTIITWRSCLTWFCGGSGFFDCP